MTMQEHLVAWDRWKEIFGPTACTCRECMDQFRGFKQQLMSKEWVMIRKLPSHALLQVLVPTHKAKAHK